MKKLEIEIRIVDNKLITAIKTEGFDRDSISHQLELLGHLEVTKATIQERINKLASAER